MTYFDVFHFYPEDADAWYERNKHKLGVGEDPVMKAIQDCNLYPKRVMEIGCANGWRLERLVEERGVEFVYGVELSELAKKDARKKLSGLYSPKRRLSYKIRGNRFVPNNLDVYGGYSAFDMVIHGFNLYVADPNALTNWVHRTDSILYDGGYLVIHDFLPEHPYSRVYEHNPKLRSRKMDHAQLWLAHPAYSLVYRETYGEGDDRTHATILRKDMANAFPLVS